VELGSRVSQGEALLLTHCSPKAKRVSRDASIRRNELVVGLATTLLVLSAPAGSASLKLAKTALRQGKPVLTPEHRMNKELLATRALPATFENIQISLR
jgi:predicted Rossmann fold nucleotide-binding protein DprA/Smf involved in DNA uptake